MASEPAALVSTAWLAKRIGDPSVTILDATWHLPPLKRDARKEYDTAHIPGAVYFDIDAVSAPGDLPHMLPSGEAFSAAVGAMGISNDSQVVVYDTHGLFSAARVWWMFRAFGHDPVAILNGGLPKWKRENLPLSSDIVTPVAQTFEIEFRPALIRNLAEVRENLETQSQQIVDARPKGRFEATAPEPRPGLRSGHIPGSRNLPFDTLLDPDSKEVLPPDRLAARFEEAGIDRSKPIICSCGTGVTACVLALGLYLTGDDAAAVYDGSWTEWGGRTDTPIKK